MSDQASPARERTAWRVGASHEIPEQGRLVVDAGDMTIGVFRIDGKLVAYENRCAHMGGPVCQGLMVPRVKEKLDEAGAICGSEFDESDMHIACPWHGYEYSLKTGRHAAKTTIGLKSVAVEERDGEVFLHA